MYANYDSETWLAAIWSDDSTEAERGKQTPEDAARFVSGLRGEVARIGLQNERMRNTFTAIRDWMLAERERNEPKDGWFDRFIVFCRETEGPCFCGCHVSHITD